MLIYVAASAVMTIVIALWGVVKIYEEVNKRRDREAVAAYAVTQKRTELPIVRAMEEIAKDTATEDELRFEALEAWLAVDWRDEVMEASHRTVEEVAMIMQAYKAGSFLAYDHYAAVLLNDVQFVYRTMEWTPEMEDELNTMLREAVEAEMVAA